METRKNKNLFWHGFRAELKKYVGNFLIFIGVIILFSKIAYPESSAWIGGVGSIVFGFVLLAKGHSQRFDYKRQSGYIVHAGDN